MTLNPGLPARLVERVQVRGGAWALSRPTLVRLLARYAPVVRAFPTPWVLVWRDADVRRVLQQDRAMAVPYMPRMRTLGAPFFLGLANSPDYTRARAAAADALGSVDLDALAEFTAVRCNERLDAARGGRIDVVTDLVDDVIARSLERFVGLHRMDAAQLDDVRASFHYVFVGRFSTRLNARAAAATRRLSRRLDGLIADRRAAAARGQNAPDHVLARLAADPVGLTDAEVRDVLIGLAAAWVANMSRATALAVDELLKRPDELGLAADPAGAAPVVLRALRRHTPTPVLERRCERELVVSGRTIAPGQRVAAVTATAMMDPRVYGEQLHFGAGPHRCLGEPIATRQMAVVVATLAGSGAIRRSGGLKWRGSFPRSLMVDLGGGG